MLFAYISLIALTALDAHGPIYDPPQPEIISPWSGSPPSTTGLGFQKSSTKSISLEKITWETWWARNRYQFLGVPTKVSPSPSSKDRDDASLREYVKSQACGLIRPYLTSSLADLKKAAILGLARMNDTHSLQSITNALTENTQTIRDTALLALGLIKSPMARFPLLHLAVNKKSAAQRFLKQPKAPEHLQTFALISLTLNKTNNIAPILRSIILSKNSSAQVKAMALECLGQVGGPDGIRLLTDLLKDKKNMADDLTASAITGLVKTNDPKSLPYLEKCLPSQSNPMVRSAVLGLGRLAPSGDNRLVKRIYGLYRASKDRAIRGFCLIALGRIGGSLAIEHLDHELLTSKSSDCGWACLGMGLALRETYQKNMVDRLLNKAENDAKRTVRSAALIGLGLVGDKKTVPPIILILQKGGDATVRCYAAMALGMIKDERALPCLRKSLFEETSPNVISQSALALALMQDTQSIELLMDLLLSSNNIRVKTFVSLGLSIMGDEEAYDLVSKALKNKDLEENTKIYCIELLSKLVSGKNIPYLDPFIAGSNFACEFPMVNDLLLKTL